MSIIDDYVNSVSEPYKASLKQILDIIRQNAPKATEGTSYGMPAFKYNGKYLIGFCAFKNHMSIFPGAEAIVAIIDELVGFKTSKGTIQFTPDKPLPDKIIKELIHIRITEIISSAARKTH